ncbi:MAG: c-type cytochrome [Acidobacteriaceae bacterium]
MASGGSRSGGSGGFFKFVLGFLFAFVVLFFGLWGYLRFGNPPVATADKPFPFEAKIVHIPLHARIRRDMQQPPFGVSEDVYETGAMAYKLQCAGCHGVPGKSSAIAHQMFPHAPQLWTRHHQGQVVGVSDDPPGATYWKIKNGIRLTGMPSFKGILTEEQMWDVALLLQHANEQLPDPVVAMLKGQ